MIPVLVTPPIDPVCDLPRLKEYRKLQDIGVEDALLESLEAGAVGYLDGWRGVLGRAIKPQTWSQEYPRWGDLALALPDVTNFSVEGFDVDGGSVAATESELIVGAGGPVVRASGASVTRVVVSYTVEMPAQQLRTAEVIVLLMVANWFEHREGNVIGMSVQEQPMAVSTLINSLRWQVT